MTLSGPFRIAAAAAVGCAAFACAAAAQAPGARNPAEDPKYYAKDAQEVVITDIASWSHPTKDVFRKHHLTLTKVELMWNRTFPVFHVADFGADPNAGPNDAFFTSLELEVLKANGNNAFKMVEDSAHDGFVVAYDRTKRTLYEQLVQGEDP